MKFEFAPHKGNFANLTLSKLPSEKYPGNGPNSIVNGIVGYSDRYGGSEWLGFEGEDLDGYLVFNEITKIESLQFKFFKGEGQWIYLPKKVTIYSVRNGVEIEVANSININATDKISQLTIPTVNLESDSLRIVVQNYGVIPDGKQGAGHRSWLFVDEIIIN